MKSKWKIQTVWWAATTVLLSAMACAPTKDSQTQALALLLPEVNHLAEASGSGTSLSTRTLATASSLHSLDYSLTSNEREILISEKQVTNSQTKSLWMGSDAKFRSEVLISQEI